MYISGLCALLYVIIPFVILPYNRSPISKMCPFPTGIKILVQSAKSPALSNRIYSFFMLIRTKKNSNRAEQEWS